VERHELRLVGQRVAGQAEEVFGRMVVLDDSVHIDASGRDWVTDVDVRGPNAAREGADGGRDREAFLAEFHCRLPCVARARAPLANAMPARIGPSAACFRSALAVDPTSYDCRSSMTPGWAEFNRWIGHHPT